MKTCISIILLFFLYACNDTPAIKSFVEKNAFPIDKNNNAGFEKIADAIGSSRIVMIGEQDHGDAPTFQLKTELIKYLCDNNGFNVIVFEDDFFALTGTVNKKWQSADSVKSFLNDNIYKSWSSCAEYSELFSDYLPQKLISTTNPIHIAGIDNQLFSTYSKNEIPNLLDSLKRECQSNSFSGIKLLPEILSKINKKSEEQNKLLNHEILLYQNCFPTTSRNSFVYKVIENLAAFNKQVSEKNFKKNDEIRDAQMASNLYWLVTTLYPTSKIIVLAANGHIMKETDKMEHRLIFKNMGTTFINLDKQLMDSIYIIGFSSGSGTAGRIGLKNYKISSPKYNSFETWMPQSSAYSFINFKAFDIHAKPFEHFNLKSPGHRYFLKFHWNTAYDGLVFVRDMYPCSTK